MAYPKATGSIILKLLVVIATAALIISILVPKKIWRVEKAEEDECHFRMLSLIDVQNEYAKLNNDAYADSLEKIIELVNSDTAFRALCDSMILILHEQIMAENVKNQKSPRLYYDVPITVDSLFTCPSTGEMFTIQWKSDKAYTIFCPVEEHETTMYTIFKKKYINHGNINHQGTVSW